MQLFFFFYFFFLQLTLRLENASNQKCSSAVYQNLTLILLYATARQVHAQLYAYMLCYMHSFYADVKI